VGWEAAFPSPYHNRLQAKAAASADALTQLLMQGLYETANKWNMQGMQRLSKGSCHPLLKGPAFPVMPAEGVWVVGGTAAACEGHP